MLVKELIDKLEYCNPDEEIGEWLGGLDDYKFHPFTTLAYENGKLTIY